MPAYIKLMGGLANQVFQYAAALSFVGEDHADDVYCDISWLKAHSDPAGGVTPRSFALEPLGAKVADTPSAAIVPLTYLPKRYNPNQDYSLQGYFQDLQYWKPWVREYIRSKIVTPYDVSIQRLWRRCVSIHVRRGDYVTRPSANAYHGVMPVEYYVDAVREISVAENTDTLSVVIYTDDEKWVEDNLRHRFRDVVAVYGETHKPWVAIEEMALRGYHVLSNSTFGWLGAYLSNSTKRVIYPHKWFVSDPPPPIFPKSWVAM